MGGKTYSCELSALDFFLFRLQEFSGYLTVSKTELKSPLGFKRHKKKSMTTKYNRVPLSENDRIDTRKDNSGYKK